MCGSMADIQSATAEIWRGKKKERKKIENTGQKFNVCICYAGRLNELKDNVENRGIRVNMNNTKVMISGERQKPVQKAARWPCGVCGRGVGSNSIQCTSCQKGYIRNVVV